MMKTALVSVALILGMALAGCPGDSDEPSPGEEDSVLAPIQQRPAVVQYYVPDCDACEKLRPLLDDLEKTFGGEMEFRRRDATDKQYQDEVRRAGARQGHRIVVLGQDAFPRYVEAEEHEGNRDLLEQKIRETLRHKPGERGRPGQ
jgi:hypothetical protein